MVLTGANNMRVSGRAWRPTRGLSNSNLDLNLLAGQELTKKKNRAQARDNAKRRNSRPEGPEAHLEQSRPWPGLFFVLGMR